MIPCSEAREQRFTPYHNVFVHVVVEAMDSTLEHPALEDQEESVRIAVRALGDMRNSAVHASPTTCECPLLFQFIPKYSSSACMEAFQPTPALSATSRSSSPSLLEEEDSPDFVSRVSRVPLVNSALSLYEHGKARSRVVKVCFKAQIFSSPPHRFLSMAQK